MVSTSPTDRRMLASSMLWSVRSEASSRRRLDEGWFARAVMNPRGNGVADSEDYPTTGSSGLKGHCQRHGITDVKYLAIAIGMTPGAGASPRRPGLRAGTHNLRRELSRESRPPARLIMNVAAHGSRIGARVARLAGTTRLVFRF